MSFRLHLTFVEWPFTTKPMLQESGSERRSQSTRRRSQLLSISVSLSCILLLSATSLGQDPLCCDVYFAGQGEHNGYCYVLGDCVDWCGGWLDCKWSVAVYCSLNGGDCVWSLDWNTGCGGGVVCVVYDGGGGIVSYQSSYCYIFCS